MRSSGARSVFVFLNALLICGAHYLRATAAADDPKTVQADAQINALLQPILEKHKLPGMTALLVQDGKVKAIGAVGVRKYGSPEPFTIDDKVHIGSCTKAMTATMIARLVERKKLSWNSSIAELFPKDKEATHPGYHKVTLKQLLMHRGEAPANVLWGTLDSKKTLTERREMILRVMLKNPPPEPIGTHFRYSNVGYIVAGLMAEKAARESWENLMKWEVFRPLGMTSAGFGPPGTPGKVDQPWCHRRFDTDLQGSQRDNPPELGPAGTIHCSMRDWARFAIVHLQGEQGQSKYLSADTFHLLHTPPEQQEYACGWGVVARSWAKGKALTHSGSNTFWYSTIWMAPERGLAFLVATNCGGDDSRKACDEAIGALLASVKK